jgi:hypothetical protein
VALLRLLIGRTLCSTVPIRLDGDGDVQVSEVEEGEFLFTAKLPRHFGTCIRVISVNRMAAFATEAKGVADRIRAELKPFEKSVVDSWQTQTHS